MNELTMRYNELQLLYEFNRLCTVFESPVEVVHFLNDLCKRYRLSSINSCITKIMAQERTFYPTKQELILLYTKMKMTPNKICNALHLNYNSYKAYLEKNKDVNISPRLPELATTIEQLLDLLKQWKGRELQYGVSI